MIYGVHPSTLTIPGISFTHPVVASQDELLWPLGRCPIYFPIKSWSPWVIQTGGVRLSHHISHLIFNLSTRCIILIMIRKYESREAGSSPVCLCGGHPGLVCEIPWLLLRITLLGMMDQKRGLGAPQMNSHVKSIKISY